MISAVRVLAWAAFAQAACGGSGSDDPDVERDPRCMVACADRSDTSIEGAGAVCDAASLEHCLDDCTTRLADTTSACADCMVEVICLSANDCFELSPDPCAAGTCTATGPKGSCKYPETDLAKRTSCHRKVDPRREVSCTADFRAAAGCDSTCR